MTRDGLFVGGTGSCEVLHTPWLVAEKKGNLFCAGGQRLQSEDAVDGESSLFLL